MITSRRFAVLALTGAMALAACGNDDPVAAPADPPPEEPSGTSSPTSTSETTTAATAGALPSDGPDATIDPEVPEEFLPAIGPVEVDGASLPILEADDVVSDPVVGTRAPVLVGEGFDGSTVRVDATASGPTMVVFLAHWCPHCNDEIPRINQLRDEGRFPDGLNIVGVATASNPSRPNFPPDEWLADKDWTYPAMADGIDTVSETFIAAEAFGVSGFPFVTLIDANGDVAARWSGGSEPDQIIALIDEHLGLG